MGVIKRQSLKFTFINLIGTFIGFLSVIFIYPLDKELYGYFQSLYSTAYLLTPILGLGIQAAIIKYYPIFEQKNVKNSFLGFSFSILALSILVSTVILALIYNLLKPFLFSKFENFQFISDNIFIIYILAILLLLCSFFIAHATTKKRIVIPDIINSLLLKLFLPLIILLMFLNYWPQELFGKTILIYFGVIAISIFIYLLSLKTQFKRPDFSAMNKAEYFGLFGFMGFSFLNSLGSSVALKLDISMIGAMVSVEAVQIYTIIMVISNILDIPARALNQIASPVISESWATNDKANIQMVYQKSSVYGLIIGLLMFLVLYFSWEDILSLMPRSLASLDVVLSIFLFLSLARITDLVTGINSVIITYSNKFKYHMYFLIILAVINVFLNYIFIKNHGIIGAAVATGISYFLFNVMKYIFVQREFQLNIIWADHIKVLIWSIAVFLSVYWIPFSSMPIINMIVKGILITGLFGAGMIWINPMGEMRDLARDFYKKLITLSKVKN